MRVYVAVAGGIDAELYLGSRSTFTLGKFGGKDGRAAAPTATRLPPARQLRPAVARRIRATSSLR